MSSSCSLRSVALGAGTPKVIVPLTATTLPALLTQADSVIAAAPDVVEWRFDFLENALQADELVAAGKALRTRLAETPLLATFRTADEGGEQVVAPEAYAALYEALIAAGVPDAVDVEIFRDEAVVDRIIAAAHAADVKVIASNHEFGHTPAAEELVRRLLLMERRGADVLKIAVMPKSPGDVLALLGATWTTSQQATRPLITMSMTATGVVSRLAGGTFGSCATFGTVGKASAPGQIPVAQLRAALAIVHAE